MSTCPDSTADPDYDPGGETGLPFDLDLRGWAPSRLSLIVAIGPSRR
jgi:hypothetical protein